MSESKERPMLFNTAMVEAILAGDKTETRRIVRVSPPGRANNSMWSQECPYGEVGDRLWVRETFALVPPSAYRHSPGVQQTPQPNDEYQCAVYKAGWERANPGSWKPSIHMPRWASRITLEITHVRIERLQNLTEEEAQKEGVNAPKGEARDAFKKLWKSINGVDSWDKNPWVWVIEFRVANK
jgi:hypothetical protein